MSDKTPFAGTFGLSLALALAAAVSLGFARFSYALLLPTMRAELHWSYFVAGAMNTANAAGYLVGALLAPRWFARFDAARVLTAGGAGAALALAAHAFARDDAMLYALRTLTGVASAATFVGGGLLAARLAQHAAHPGRVLGLYYGGTGLGIVGSTLIVPPLPWRAAWLALAAASLACTAITAVAIAAARRGPAAIDTAPAQGAARAGVRWAPMAYALAAYLMFGFGYIGYMTFIVTLLREQGVGAGLIAGFYALLGAGVVASSWLWAGLLQRARGGQALAWLNGLLALATLVPVLGSQALLVAGSCLLFGCTFLSVVASTTAFVRHNLPAAAWTAGIAAFTIVFAAGQILGPSLTGWLADGPGGLRRGFLGSAAALALGAVLALRQRPLKSEGSGLQA
jgi:predicted MFS family arabinose efflux permease